jgi:hypothetical protein
MTSPWDWLLTFQIPWDTVTGHGSLIRGNCATSKFQPFAAEALLLNNIIHRHVCVCGRRRSKQIQTFLLLAPHKGYYHNITAFTLLFRASLSHFPSGGRTLYISKIYKNGWLLPLQAPTRIV